MKRYGTQLPDLPYETLKRVMLIGLIPERNNVYYIEHYPSVWNSLCTRKVASNHTFHVCNMWFTGFIKSIAAFCIEKTYVCYLVRWYECDVRLRILGLSDQLIEISCHIWFFFKYTIHLQIFLPILFNISRISQTSLYNFLLAFLT